MCYIYTMVVHFGEQYTGYQLVTLLLPLIGYLYTLWQMNIRTGIFVITTTHKILLHLRNKKEKRNYVQHLPMDNLYPRFVGVYDVLCNCLFLSVLFMLHTLITVVIAPFLPLLWKLSCMFYQNVFVLSVYLYLVVSWFISFLYLLYCHHFVSFYSCFWPILGISNHF